MHFYICYLSTSAVFVKPIIKVDCRWLLSITIKTLTLRYVAELQSIHTRPQTLVQHEEVPGPHM